MKKFNFIIFFTLFSVSLSFGQTAKQVQKQILQFEQQILNDQTDSHAVNLISQAKAVQQQRKSSWTKYEFEVNRTIRQQKNKYLIENYPAYAQLVRKKSQLIRANMDRTKYPKAEGKKKG